MESVKKPRHSPHEHRVLILGIGGSGINVLNRVECEWNDRLKACAVDTDHQTLSTCNNVSSIHLETRTTQGMSTAGDVDAGRHAVRESRERLSALCASVDLVFIIAGFGGGTGTGGALALAEIASDTGALVLGFVMMPFEFEGVEREKTARDGLALFQDVADGVVVMQNQRLLDMVEDKTSLPAAFEVVSTCVAQNIRAMWRLITAPGLINLDFADIRRMVMGSHGLCTLVSEECEGDDRCRRLVDAVLKHPLFDCGDVLSQSRGIMVGISGGNDLTLRDLQLVMEGLRSVTGENARVVMGTAIDPLWKGKMGLLVLASERFELEGSQVPHLDSAEPEQGAGSVQGRRKKSKVVQSKLNLDAPGKGRFKDVEPTLRNGEDLDVPAFLRRGVKLRN